MPTRAGQRTSRAARDSKSLHLSSHIDPGGQGDTAVLEMTVVHTEQYARKLPKVQTATVLYLVYRRELVLPGLVSTLIPESTKLRVLARALV